METGGESSSCCFVGLGAGKRKRDVCSYFSFFVEGGRRGSEVSVALVSSANLGENEDEGEDGVQDHGEPPRTRARI